jgi:hypothetical protein
MTTAPLELTRDQVLAHRRRAGALDRRLPWGSDSLRTAGWPGFQDSMPRAAQLSIHARVASAGPDAWADPSLVQVWGPRYGAYVVPAEDWWVFTTGRYPLDERKQAEAEHIADRLEALLDGGSMSYADAGHALGWNPNYLRYATTTGRLLIRWEGALRPTVRVVPAPAMDPSVARAELARRHLRVLGPSTVESLSEWAGLKGPAARAALDALREELVPVRTPIGEGWILASDEASFLAPPDEPAAARLLPSGDAFWLLQGAERSLLVSDPALRNRLWTPRVWPGAILAGGEIVGTWRRADHVIRLSAWRTLSAGELEAVEAEARSLPLPGVERDVDIRWED